MSDYDRDQWQAEEEAREKANSAYRDKMSKARERSANNAKRKIARLHAKLTELGHISEFEDEFGESVLERLEKYGSAFHDPEKGRAGDALSMAQRQVVNRMNRKVKELKAKAASASEGDDFEDDYTRTHKAERSPWSGRKKTQSSFKSKKPKSFTPNIRYIDDEEDLDSSADKTHIHKEPSGVGVDVSKVTPFIPRYNPKLEDETPERSVKKEGAKRPFLRLVKSDN